MKTLREPLAVVTGAASGIGFALATRFAGEGMKVALADVEERALADATRIDAADRNRPERLRAKAAATPERELVGRSISDAIRRGIPPEAIAERTLRAIREDRFYVLSDDDWRRVAESRCDDIHLARNPTLRIPNLE